ncbi:MAG: Rieske 2Fe-2S domain-containing protein [Gammaproteobacteria bacterium]|jgi:toluene monooxygenase system ferredoxin subunit
MAFEKLCRSEDVAPGAMAEFSTRAGTRVLVIRQPDGAWAAFQALCPHAAVELVAGTLSDGILTCREHWWQFDAANGLGTNPAACHLACYPLQIASDDVLVDVTGVEPFKAGRPVS